MLLILGGMYVQAQVLTHTIEGSWEVAKGIDNLWELDIEGAFGEGELVYVQGRILNDQGEITLQAQSSPFLPAISTGLKQVRGIPTELAEEVQMTAPGVYRICTSIKTINGGRVLSSSCSFVEVFDSVFVETQPAVSTTKSDGKNLLARPRGNIALIGFASNQQRLFQQLPPQYLQSHGQMSIAVAGIPLKADYFVTSATGANVLTPNSVNLSLDVQGLRRQLKREAEARIKRNLEAKAAGLPFDTVLLTSLELDRQQIISDISDSIPPVYRSLLDPDSLANFTKNNEELLRVEEYLADPRLRGIRSDWYRDSVKYGLKNVQALRQIEDSLKVFHPDAYEKVKIMLQRKRELDALLEKKASLESYLSTHTIPTEYLSKIEALQALADTRNLQSLLLHPDRLQHTQLFNKAEGFLSHFQELEFGNLIPRGNELVYGGAMIKGFSAFYQNAAGWMIGGMAGQTVPLTFQVIPGVSPLQRLEGVNKTGGFKAGIERGQGNSLQVEGIYTWGRRPAEEESGKNYLGSVEGRLGLFKGHVQLKGNYAYSLSENAGMLIQEGQIGPAFTQDSLFANEQVVGTAWEAGAIIRLGKGNTLLEGQYRKIGPHYFTPFSPFLPYNTTRFMSRISQAFWKRQIEISAYYRQDQLFQLPLLGLSNGTLPLIQRAGIRFQARGEGWPYVQLDYAPFSQLVSLDTAVNTRPGGIFSTLSATAGHTYQLRNASLNTHFMLTGQLGGKGEEDFRARNDQVSFTQSVQIPRCLTLLYSLTYIHINAEAFQNSIWNSSLTVSVPHRSGIQPRLTLRYLKAEGNLPQEIWEGLVGLQGSIGKGLSAQIDLGWNRIGTYPIEDYPPNEWIGKLSINYTL